MLSRAESANVGFSQVVQLPYFPDYKPRLFFKNFSVAAYIAVRLMCGRLQETTVCLDQHLITISSPTVLHNH